MRVLEKLDRDGDGFVSRDEARAASAEAATGGPILDFEKADRDRDDRLSLEEIEQAIRNHPDSGPTFQAGDVNGDGMLSGTEQESLKVLPQIRIPF